MYILNVLDSLRLKYGELGLIVTFFLNDPLKVKWLAEIFYLLLKFLKVSAFLFITALVVYLNLWLVRHQIFLNSHIYYQRYVYV